MIRSIVAVIAGYFVFAVSAVLLFSITGRDPHDNAPAWFLITSIVYGGVFAAIGGYLSAVIAKRNQFLHAGLVTIVIGSGALISLLSKPGKGAIWSQLSALLIMAPSAMIGGYLWARKSKNGNVVNGHVR